MKYLHLVSTEKFIEPYVQFINKNFDIQSHQFLSFTSSAENFITGNYENVSFQNKVFNNFTLLSALYKSDTIYMHALFNVRIIILLFFHPWLLKKCYWVVWGADLYAYRKRKVSLKNKTQEFFRKFAIKRFAGLITHVEGDYELAKEWYGAKGRHYYSFMYPSNLYKDIEICPGINNQSIYIQVGNSADPSNNHIEILNKLKALDRSDIQIIVPLSYGNKEYARKIEKIGTKMFGENFTPLKEFIPFNEYLHLLREIDIAIFNHDRQQALGNITTLIGLGKTIYMKSEITSTKFLKSIGIQVFDVENIIKDLPVLSEKAIKENINIIKDRFSEEELVKDLKKIFE